MKTTLMFVIEFYNQVKGSARSDKSFVSDVDAYNHAIVLLAGQAWDEDKSPYKWQSFRIVPIYELST